MQFVAVSNKKVNREWQRRKTAVIALRKSTGNNRIPLPKFPDVVNEYINKGFKYDSLQKENQSSTTKKNLTVIARTKKAGNSLEERKKCPAGKE